MSEFEEEEEWTKGRGRRYTISMPALTCPKCGCQSIIQTMVSQRRVYYICNNPDCQHKWSYGRSKGLLKEIEV